MSQQSVETESKQGVKRTASDIDANDRPAKRAKTDSDRASSESGFVALTKDILTEISYHLDITGINSMFSASKSLRNHIDWHASATQDFWCQIVRRKYPNYELKLAEGDEGPLPWRDIYIGTERKLTLGTQRLQKYLKFVACQDPKLSEAEKLDNTRAVLAKLEYQQTLLEQVNAFLEENPTMRTFWESRVFYTRHKVLAGLEWSTENYKWDVTNTAIVNLTIIGKNGDALFLTALTAYFACYWGAGQHSLIKSEVMSVTEISPAMEGDLTIDKKLFPETPQEDNDEDAILKDILKEGYEHMKTVDWKKNLDEIGLADVDPALFAKLIQCAAFPDKKRARYSTETTGYYSTRGKSVDRKLSLPGVGGTVLWG